MSRLLLFFAIVLVLGAIVLPAGPRPVAAQTPDGGTPSQGNGSDGRRPHNVAVQADETSITVSWETAVATSGWLLSGSSPEALEEAVFDRRGQDVVDTRYEVTVEGLAPGGVYYLAIVSGGEIFASGESLFKVVMPGEPEVTAFTGTPEPDESNRPVGVTITEAGEGHLVVAWETVRAHSGWVVYGIAPDALTGLAYDVRGQGTVDTQHQVSIQGLVPGRLYYIAIVSQGERFDNSGSPFKAITRSVEMAAEPSPPPSEAEAPAPTSPSEPATVNGPVEIDYETVAPVPAELRTPIAEAVASSRTLLPPENRLVVTALRHSGEWMEAILVPVRVVEAGWEVPLAPNETIEVLGRRRPTGGIVAAVRGSPGYTGLLAEVPAEFLDTADISALAPATVNYLFPWIGGQEWYKTQGWHSGNAIDFQPVVRVRPDPDLVVLAAAGGRLTELCNDGYQSTVRIEHSEGPTTYLHLDRNSIPRNLLGRQVERGQFLGLLYNGSQGAGWYNGTYYQYRTSCGWGTGVHLHFVLPQRSVTIDGYSAETVAGSAFATRYRSSNVRLGSGDGDDGRVLSSGQTLDGTINPSTDQDSYFFDASRGQMATLRMNRISSALDGYLILYGPDGREVASDDDSGGSLNPWINRASLPQSGRYRVVASSYAGYSSGGYRLSLTLEAGGGSSGNLALNKPSWATSQEDSRYSPRNGNDGNGGTRWSSQVSGLLGWQWYKVDLGEARRFRRFVVKWEWAYGARYWVAWCDTNCTSNDNSNWYGFERQLSSRQDDVVDFWPQTHRYVGILMTQRAPRMNNYSFWEFEVFDGVATSGAEPLDQPRSLPAAADPAATIHLPLVIR